MDTGVPAATLKSIARRLVDGIPAGFELHRKIRKLMQDFAATVEADGALNWANAETLAFGSLLLDGYGVRLSGEDSRRGTFSQRHAALYDQRTGEIYIPLTNLEPDQPQFCVYDSSLAEASVLAFDYGYSLADPNRLIMWEAQFGDFANGAQVHHRPVHRGRAVQVEPPQRAGDAAAARLRGAGAGALQRVAAAVPDPVRRGQHAGGAAQHARRSSSMCCAARCCATSAGRWWC